jgi:N-acetylglutamate synthase-like GNAT family acetyltransferase
MMIFQKLVVTVPTMLIIILFILVTIISIHDTNAFVLPTYGIGSILFPVRDVSDFDYISTIRDNYDKKLLLSDAGDFFVDAFWTSKVGGGSRTLTTRQKQNLQQSQIAEFTKRYGGSSSSSSSSRNKKQSEFIIIRTNNKDNIIGCVGVEIDRIPDGYMKGPTSTIGPLMSNLAISKSYRRRGLAEKLVYAVEQHVLKQWGYDECYLYVEERNKGAVSLYTKLGYKFIWKDTQTTTLLPTSDGNVQSTPTTIICMRKNLNQRSIFDRLFQR